MNNFKVLMNGIVKENPTFVLLLGMCPTFGYNIFCHQRYGYGTCYNVRSYLFKHCNLFYQEACS